MYGFQHFPKSGIYDVRGFYVRGIIPSSMSNVDNRFLLPNQIINLFKKTGYTLTKTMFDEIIKSKQVNLLPSGYYVDKKFRVYNLYDYNRFLTIMLYRNSDGGFAYSNARHKYILSSFGVSIFEKTYIKKKKETVNYHDINIEMRARYDVSEKDNEI